MTKLLTEEQEEHYGPNGIGFDPSKLVVKCGPADERDERLVIASLYGATHRDKFNTDESWKRQKFREKFSSLCGCETPEFFEAVEAEIMAKADAADAISDAASGPLWTPSLVSLADIETKDVRWFWPGVMPEGAITVLDSDPGEGKSTITDDVAARYSAGNSMPPHSAPDGTYTPGNVLILDGEEDIQRTRKPRLIAAGADVNRVYFLRTTKMEDDERFIQLPLDLPTIEQVVVDRQIGLIIIDVLATFIQDGTSMNDDAAMRKLTGPLANMLERTRATCLMLRHLNKKENLRGMYRGGGSIAIVAAARAAYTIASHPDDPGMKVFACVKSNLAPKPHSLTFTIEALNGIPTIRWGDHTDLTASDIMGTPKQGGANKFETAKSIIADALSGGPRGSNEVEAACRDAGVSDSTYWRARRAMGVQAEKTGFNDGQWLLSIPSDNGRLHEGCHDDF